MLYSLLENCVFKRKFLYLFSFPTLYFSAFRVMNPMQLASLGESQQRRSWLSMLTIIILMGFAQFMAKRKVHKSLLYVVLKTINFNQKISGNVLSFLISHYLLFIVGGYNFILHSNYENIYLIEYVYWFIYLFVFNGKILLISL